MDAKIARMASGSRVSEVVRLLLRERHDPQDQDNADIPMVMRSEVLCSL